MKLLIARHGETAWNVENRVSGRTDVPLTEKGLQQAQLLAQNAVGKGIEVILASPLLRARQTAQAVSDAIGVPVEIDERLIELDFGSFEGAPRTDPGFQYTRAQFPTRYPGGESAFMLAHRVYACLEDVKRQHDGKTVLLVCHGGVCRMVRSYFMDLSNDEYSYYYADNAELVEYEM